MVVEGFIMWAIQSPLIILNVKHWPKVTHLLSSSPWWNLVQHYAKWWSCLCCGISAQSPPEKGFNFKCIPTLYRLHSYCNWTLTTVDILIAWVTDSSQCLLLSALYTTSKSQGLTLFKGLSLLGIIRVFFWCRSLSVRVLYSVNVAFVTINTYFTPLCKSANNQKNLIGSYWLFKALLNGLKLRKWNPLQFIKNL